MTRTARIVDPAEIDAAETFALAVELATYARAAHDAIAMIEAARLLTPLPREAFSPHSATPISLLAEARIIASGDNRMLAEIDAVQHGRPRPVASCYAADSWVVAWRGNGIGLSATPAPRVAFRIGEPAWTGPFTGKAA